MVQVPSKVRPARGGWANSCSGVPPISTATSGALNGADAAKCSKSDSLMLECSMPRLHTWIVEHWDVHPGLCGITCACILNACSTRSDGKHEGGPELIGRAEQRPRIALCLALVDADPEETER